MKELDQSGGVYQRVEGEFVHPGRTDYITHQAEIDYEENFFDIRYEKTRANVPDIDASIGKIRSQEDYRFIMDPDEDQILHQKSFSEDNISIENRDIKFIHDVLAEAGDDAIALCSSRRI